MKIKNLLIVLVLIAMLAVFPAKVQAATASSAGITVTYPDNQTTCPSDGAITVAITGANIAKVRVDFMYYDGTWHLTQEFITSSATLQFPYPSTPAEFYMVGVTGFDASGNVIDGTQLTNMKWTSTCTPPPPPPSGQGCTPGYWRNHAWPAGIAKTADFDAFFGVDFFNPNITLGQAVVLGGGGKNALARHAVAAVLNVRAGLNYAYTETQIIAMVQAAASSGDYTTAKDKLEYANEIYCPLN